jgi:hypothetical protein
MARPPPTRPHISLNPSPHFSYSITEWGDDDAWDSASDSESQSNSQTTWSRSPQPTPTRPSGATSAPKPVPRPSQNSSSSTLAFSYTHVSAPSPGSSYPPHGDTIVPTPTTTRNGWTIVQKAGRDGGVTIDDKTEPHDVGPDREGEHEMVFEDLEAEFVDMPVLPRVRPDAACVRNDAAEIANGAQRPFSYVFLCECPE